MTTVTSTPDMSPPDRGASQRVFTKDVPIEIRYEAGRNLVKQGFDPHEALWLALFPDDETSAFFEGEERLTPNEDYCVNGHALTHENTVYRRGKWKSLKSGERKHYYARRCKTCLAAGFRNRAR